MTYKASLKVSFDSEWTSTHHSSGFDDTVLPEEHYTFEVPAEDLNIHQLFRFFATVARAMGHDEVNIMKGGCSIAFSEMYSTAVMRKVAEEYDVILREDYDAKVKEAVAKEKEIDEEWARIRSLMEVTDKLRSENLDLKAKLSRFENPDNPNYTDEEIDAMCYEADKK